MYRTEGWRVGTKSVGPIICPPKWGGGLRLVEGSAKLLLGSLPLTFLLQKIPSVQNYNYLYI